MSMRVKLRLDVEYEDGNTQTRILIVLSIKITWSITQVQCGSEMCCKLYLVIQNLKNLCDEYTFRYGKIHSTDQNSEIWS